MPKRPATHSLPPLLVAIAEHVSDQPNLDQLDRAIRAAGHVLQLSGSSLTREEARQRFIQEEGEDGAELDQLDYEGVVAAQVSFGDPAFLFGLACGWLLVPRWCAMSALVLQFVNPNSKRQPRQQRQPPIVVKAARLHALAPYLVDIVEELLDDLIADASSLQDTPREVS